MRNALLLTGAIVFAAFCDVGVRAEPPKANRVSGPHIHENLAIYFIHGPSTPGPVPLTLAEALAKGHVRVIETGNVNALEVENLGTEGVFIQSGDIVKGGQQDRVLTVSLLLPAGSGRVSIDSFCVEAGRWAARGVEDVRLFSSSRDALPSRAAKLAMRMPTRPLDEARPAPGDQTAALPRRVGVLPQRADTGDRQRRVWSEVARIQDGLSAGVGARVAEPQSATSLQLSLEHEKLRAARAAYVAALEPRTTGHDDIVGFVFAIDGRINSADVYPSNGLFQKMWSKLLTASVTEAVSVRSNQPTTTSAPPVAAVEVFIADAEAGKLQEQAIAGLMHQSIREADTALYVETRAASATTFVHRNYLAKH